MKSSAFASLGLASCGGATFSVLKDNRPLLKLGMPVAALVDDEWNTPQSKIRYVNKQSGMSEKLKNKRVQMMLGI
jgi:hypothetical protein